MPGRFGAGHLPPIEELGDEMRGQRQRQHHQERLEGQRFHFLMRQPPGEHIHRAARILDVEARNRHEDTGEVRGTHAGEHKLRQIGLNAARERISACRRSLCTKRVAISRHLNARCIVASRI